MSSVHRPGDPAARDEGDIRALYRRLLDSWNQRDAARFAALFTEDGSSVGFDGSPMSGRAEIAATIGQIFTDHQTAAYVAIVREVRMLAPGAAVLRAVVGMVPPGQSDLNPAVNAIQSLVAIRDDGQWRIALLQSTPAAFHGRPELSESLTAELRQELTGAP